MKARSINRQHRANDARYQAFHLKAQTINRCLQGSPRATISKMRFCSSSVMAFQFYSDDILRQRDLEFALWIFIKVYGTDRIGDYGASQRRSPSIGVDLILQRDRLNAQKRPVRACIDNVTLLRLREFVR